MMKEIRKFRTRHIVLFTLGALFMAYLIYSYSTQKESTGPEQMSGRKTQEMYEQTEGGDASMVKPSEPLGQNETYASAEGSTTSTPGMPPSCSRKPVADPSELLPKDTNSQWAALNPTGSGDLENVNLLKSGYHMGIDTVGNTLRNANLQLRSEPANPQLNVGPWHNTTIAPDTMRVPLELGQGKQ